MQARHLDNVGLNEGVDFQGVDVCDLDTVFFKTIHDIDTRDIFARGDDVRSVSHTAS